MSQERAATGKEEKKSRTLIGCLARMVLFAVTVYGAIKALTRVMGQLTNRLEEDNEGNEKKRYLSFMNGRKLRVREEKLSDMEAYAVAAGLEVDLTEAELTGDARACVRALGSGVVIKVPSMVRVEVENSSVLSGFVNLVPEYENEKLPVLHLTVQSILSGVRVEMKTE